MPSLRGFRRRSRRLLQRNRRSAARMAGGNLQESCVRFWRTFAQTVVTCRAVSNNPNAHVIGGRADPVLRLDLSVAIRRSPATVFALLADTQDYEPVPLDARVRMTKHPSIATRVGTSTRVGTCWDEEVRIAPGSWMSIESVVTDRATTATCQAPEAIRRSVARGSRPRARRATYSPPRRASLEDLTYGAADDVAADPLERQHHQ